jgi:hypothetical protein
MAANLNYRITVNLLAAAPAVSTADFDVILVLSAGATFAGTTIVKSYNSPVEIDADTELTAPLKAFAKQLFAQSVNPGKIKIGEAGVGADFGADLALCMAYDPAFYGVAIHNRSATEIAAIADDIGTYKKLMVAQTSDAAVLAGTPGNILLTLETAGYGRVACFYHATDTEALDLSLMAYKLSCNPDERVTTWANCNLTGIAADSLTAAQRDQVTGDSGNVYMPFHGVACTFPGKAVDGGWIDAVISGDWAVARIQEGIAQLLLDVSSQNSKVTFDGEGMQQIASVPRRVLKRGESIGHLRKGSSVVHVPLMEDISGATVQSRELTLLCEAILAGAIDQKVTISLVVSNS